MKREPNTLHQLIYPDSVFYHQRSCSFTQSFEQYYEEAFHYDTIVAMLSRLWLSEGERIERIRLWVPKDPNKMRRDCDNYRKYRKLDESLVAVEG